MTTKLRGGKELAVSMFHLRLGPRYLRHVVATAARSSQRQGVPNHPEDLHTCAGQVARSAAATRDVCARSDAGPCSLSPGLFRALDILLAAGLCAALLGVLRVIS